MAVEVTWLVHTLCCSGTILMNLLLGAIIIKTILKYNSGENPVLQWCGLSYPSEYQKSTTNEKTNAYYVIKHTALTIRHLTAILAVIYAPTVIAYVGALKLAASTLCAFVFVRPYKS
ncbi:hypothetical protein PRIPAC_96638 [Pristionchus pacificus]|uniref:Uncharacterized protein n=1 Tax=Pristionchus pacificus TaxID=54126 RepID=A0A2A6D2J9_PRIPA|nr:hypothetical protein PRIPAC_96638 [Pristionchus pacificus]|eukprot:PDM84537.1 hypothetical protein PRIPAC_33560 [Pristionchus pacificus]